MIISELMEVFKVTTKTASIEAKWDEDFEKKIEQKIDTWASSCGKKKVGSNAGAGVVYCFGLVGALVYYIQTSSGFWDGVVGVFKALVWPGFLVFELLKFFKL